MSKKETTVYSGLRWAHIGFMAIAAVIGIAVLLYDVL